MKKPKLIEVEKLHPLNRKTDGAFLIIFRQAVCLALEEERKQEKRSEKCEDKP